MVGSSIAYTKTRLYEFNLYAKIYRYKLIKAADACRLCINMLDGLTNEVSWFMEKEKSISTNAVFQKQIQEYTL